MYNNALNMLIFKMINIFVKIHVQKVMMKKQYLDNKLKCVQLVNISKLNKLMVPIYAKMIAQMINHL